MCCIKFIATAALSVLLLSCSNMKLVNSVSDSEVKINWFGEKDRQFPENLQIAFERLNSFLKTQNLSTEPVQSLIKEVVHFNSKALFDSEMIKLSNGQLKSLPRTYVAVGESGILRTISQEAYLKIHPNHNKRDFVNILVHEAFHIFHARTYSDEGMGPVWFFEGMAIVAADQYIDEVTLTKDEMRAVASTKERGDYKKYGFMVRELKKTYPLDDMLQKAKDEPKNFLNYLGLK